MGINKLWTEDQDEDKDKDKDKTRTRRYRKGKIMHNMSPLLQELFKWGTHIYEDEQEEEKELEEEKEE